MHPRTVVALLSGFVTTAGSTGCIVAPHDGFDTPQDTVLTFQSAFARDDEFKEYDCFSDGFRESQGLSQQKWSIARSHVFDSFGATGRFVLRRNSLADNLVGGAIGRERASLVYELFGNRLDVELVPEPVLRFVNPITGASEDWPLAESAGSDSLRAAIDVGRELAQRLESEGVAWAELRSKWKVDALAAREAEGPPPPLASGDPLPATAIGVDAIRFTRSRESLGVVRLVVSLPLAPGAGGVIRWVTPPTR